MQYVGSYQERINSLWMGAIYPAGQPLISNLKTREGADWEYLPRAEYEK